MPVFGHSMVQYDNSLLSVGGLTTHGDINTIFSLSCESRQCSWSKLNQELSRGRSGMVAIVAPELMTYC